MPEETDYLFARGFGGRRVLYPDGPGQADRDLVTGQGGNRRAAGAGELFRGRVSRWASGVDGHGRRYGKIHARPH